MATNSSSSNQLPDVRKAENKVIVLLNYEHITVKFVRDSIAHALHYMYQMSALLTTSLGNT